MYSNNSENPPKDVAVVMVPFPLQGHLNQLLHLSRLISAHNIIVHFVGTATHNHQARHRIHGFYPQSISNIIFHDFPSLRHKSPPPDPNSPIKFPSHLQPLMNATSNLRQPVANILRDLSATCKRVVIIYDSLMGSVIQDFVHLPNAETYTFHSISAFSIFFFLWEKMGKPLCLEDEILEKFISVEGCFTPEFIEFVGKQHDFMKLNSGRIYNTCRVIESQVLDLLAKPEITGNKMQWALGPFNPVNTGTDKIYKRGSYSCEKCLIINWLNMQAPNSVLFISFGTTTSLSDEQIAQLALGLQKSDQKFIWVLRDADRGDFTNNEIKKSTLPHGFEEKIKERGIIVRNWAPQLEILGHFATGGFMSHCGWNSCMESISMGVPIATWPMHSDQPRNAVLITEVLKIGLVVKDWEKRKELVESEMVESVVRRLMVSVEGEEIRKRAAKLGGAVREAVVEDGVTRLEFESFISHITREN